MSALLTGDPGALPWAFSLASIAWRGALQVDLRKGRWCHPCKSARVDGADIE